MNCSRIQDLLADYSVEILDARTHQTVEGHLAACVACRKELQVMDAVVALVEEQGVRQPPVGLFNGVRNRIESGAIERERPAWWAWLSTGPARALAMGGAMAAVALGLLMPTGSHYAGPVLPDIHAQPGGGSAVASGELAGSIRQHALSAAEGPLTDRVAWEAMAQLVSQDGSGDRARIE